MTGVPATPGTGGALPHVPLPVVLLLVALVGVPVAVGVGGRLLATRGSPAAPEPAPAVPTEQEPVPTLPPEPSPTPGPDYAGKNVRGDDFTSEQLAGANFDRARAAGATFMGTDLTRASFVGANLRKADFTAANLFEANLTDADLRSSTLMMADLTGAALDGANLSRSGVTEATLRGASLRGADLTGAWFPQTDLSGADLSGATIDRTDFTGSDGVTDEMLAAALGVSPGRLHTELQARRVNLEEVRGLRIADRVCAGRAEMDDAAPYRGKFHPMIVGGLGQGEWENAFDAKGWLPVRLEYTQLVACAQKLPPIRSGDYCTYVGQGERRNVYLWRRRWRVSIVEARTGKVLFSQDGTGDLPYCPMQIPSSQHRLYGMGVQYKDVKPLLAPYAGVVPD